MVPTVVLDNWKLFSTEREEVETYLSALGSVASLLRSHIGAEERFFEQIMKGGRPRAPRPNRVPEVDFEYCMGLLFSELQLTTPEDPSAPITSEAVIRLSEGGFSDEFLSRMRADQFPFSMKIMVYLLWRALLMNIYSIREGARTPKVLLELILEEVNDCLVEYNDLARVLRNRHDQGDRPFCDRDGAYSREGCVSPGYLASLAPGDCVEKRLIADVVPNKRQGVYVCSVDDSIALLDQLVGEADIIATDPPYGFNTDEGSAEMQSLFATLIPRLVRALKTRGQLLLAVPAFAKNGKRIPYYQTQGSIVRQVFGSVEAEGRRIVQYVGTLPRAKQLHATPWYWGTENIVERRILHFIIE